MRESVFFVLFYTLIGAGTACVGRYWLRRLCEKRNLSYPVSSDMDIAAVFVMAAVGAVAAACIADGPAPMICLIFVLIGLTVSVLDLNYRVIPNDAVLVTLCFKVLLLITGLTDAESIGSGIISSLAGFAVCFLVFAFPSALGKKVGAGDVKLAAAFGFLLGIRASVTGLVIMGLMVLGSTLLQRKMPISRYLVSEIPMGPFISAGMFTAYLGTVMRTSAAIL